MSTVHRCLLFSPRACAETIPRSSARGSLLVSTFCFGWHQPLGWSASFEERRVFISFRLFYLSEKRAIFRTFTPTLFAGLGGRAAVDKALQRLVARDELRRLSRGLYDKPRQDPLLGTLWPSIDAVVAALTGKDKLRLQPTGAYAANLLGLSDQVPARVEFLTDGTSRTIKAGPMQIVLKRTTPRQMAAAGRTSGLVIQALRSLGPEHVTPQRLDKLTRSIPAAERRTLLDDLSLAPGWMQPTLRALATDR